MGSLQDAAAASSPTKSPSRENCRDADARWTDPPREDLDNFMDGVVDDEDRESMTLVLADLGDRGADAPRRTARATTDYRGGRQSPRPTSRRSGFATP